MNSRRRRVRASALLAVGAFAVGTDGSVLAGVLPRVAGDLRVGVEAAGLLVTAFAIAYAVLGPVLAVLTGTWARRRALLAALGVFLLGNVLTAVAPAYDGVLAGRLIAAAGAALYTPTAIATAAKLAGRRNRARTMSAVVLGYTLSSALGVPIGAALGAAWGWRGTLWFVVALGSVAAVAVACLGDVPAPGGRFGFAERLAPLRDRRVLLLLAVTVTLFTGTNAYSSYVSLVFGDAVGGHGYRLAVLLFASGAAGTAGNLLAGFLADRFGARPVLVVVASVLVLDFLLMPLSGRTMAGALAAAVVYGLMVWSVTVPQQQRLIACAPSAPALVLSLNSSAISVAVALGAAAGGAIVRLAGTAFVTTFAAALVAVGLGLSETAHRTQSKHREELPSLV